MRLKEKTPRVKGNSLHAQGRTALNCDHGDPPSCADKRRLQQASQFVQSEPSMSCSTASSASQSILREVPSMLSCHWHQSWEAKAPPLCIACCCANEMRWPPPLLAPRSSSSSSDILEQEKALPRARGVRSKQIRVSQQPLGP